MGEVCESWYEGKFACGESLNAEEYLQKFVPGNICARESLLDEGKFACGEFVTEKVFVREIFVAI